MKIMVIGHSYLETEIQKNIKALQKYADIHCIVPSIGRVNLSSRVIFSPKPDLRNLFISYRPLNITRSQYLLLTPTMNFNKIKPDIIVVDYHPWSLIYFQTLLFREMYCRKAVIVSSIKKNTFRYNQNIFGFIKKWLAQRSHHWVDHVLSESKMVKSLLINELKFPRSKISLAKYLGVDINVFKPQKKIVNGELSAAKCIVGYCGRFDIEKGVLDLVEAMKNVVEKSHMPVVLRLMGKGTHHFSVDSQLEELSKIFKWMEVLPPVSNNEVSKFLKKIDIFVLPSRILEDHQEHDAHILLEALASGVPCIGTRTGVIPEILGNEVGILVRPEDPKALSNAIIRLVNKFSLRKKLAYRGRTIAEDQFSLEAIASRKIKIYRSVLEKAYEK
jgi:glycosyltransferase involved in cell wall biosynthesis